MALILAKKDKGRIVAGPKRKPIKIRLLESESERISSLANAAGVNRSRYIRAAALGDADKLLTAALVRGLVPLVHELKEIRAALVAGGEVPADQIEAALAAVVSHLEPGRQQIGAEPITWSSKTSHGV